MRGLRAARGREARLAVVEWQLLTNWEGLAAGGSDFGTPGAPWVVERVGEARGHSLGVLGREGEPRS